MLDGIMENDVAEKPANQSVAKLLQLFFTLSESRSPMRLQDIASGVDMAQSTVLRYLNALIQEGYAYKDELLGRYALTWKICGVGQRVRGGLSIRTLAGELINELSGRLGLGVCLVVEHDMECIYLDCVYEPNMMGPTLQRIGKQTPMHSTSSGKLFLTRFSEEKIDELVRRKTLTKLTPATITTKEALMAEIEKVRNNGFAMDDEECEEGLRCFAFPIYDYQGQIAAAISCFGSKERLTDEFIDKTVKPELLATAMEISFRMGSNYEGGAQLK